MKGAPKCENSRLSISIKLLKDFQLWTFALRWWL